MDELTEEEMTILKILPETDTGRALAHLIAREEHKADIDIDTAKIGCEEYQKDIRFALGVRKGIETLKRALFATWR